MKNMINKTHIEGYLYEHALEMKESGPNSKNPGTKFITGTVSIATDEAGVNIVPVHFTYVTATTATGKANNTFTVLSNIVDGNIGTVMKDGKAKAGKLRIDSALGLNEFFTDRNGKEELVSAKRNEGGFVHMVDVLVEDEKDRNTFECDMIITGATRIEANEERQTPEKVIVKGAIFDFRKNLLPIEFSALNPNAMNYFEDLGATSKEPVFTKIKGRQVSETVVKTIVEKSAFGDDSVKEVKNSRRDFVITWAAEDPYVWDDESTITVAELNEAISKREVDLAAMKTRQDEYRASRGNAAAPANKIATPSTGAFNF
jgi:hypothetical protein